MTDSKELPESADLPTTSAARGRVVADPSAVEVRTIKPSPRFAAVRPRELWQARELLYFLVWRNLKVRYKQTAIGATWSVLQPLLLMLLLTVVFEHFAHLSSGDIPYPVLVFAGLIPWGLLAYSLSFGGNSLVSNENLITKVYVPRLVIPSAAVLSGLFDVGLGFATLAVFLAYYGIVPSLAILALPLFLLFAVVVALGVVFWLSALNVRYRDVQGIVPFLALAWFYATPVAYPISVIPESWRLWVGLNPLAGVVAGVRWSIFPGVSFEPLIYISAAAAVVILVTALVYFSATERSFADVV
jgi:homopolymeric O-antigen transport system permease protein